MSVKFCFGPNSDVIVRNYQRGESGSVTALFSAIVKGRFFCKTAAFYVFRSRVSNTGRRDVRGDRAVPGRWEHDFDVRWLLRDRMDRRNWKRADGFTQESVKPGIVRM